MHAQTALVLLNLGGPSSLDEVGGYLRRLFTDREMMTLPAQATLGAWLAKWREGEVQRRYAQIGGASPQAHWTGLQGDAMAAKLSMIKPSKGPFRAYLAMRHATPNAETALRALVADGVKRAVAFSMYPHFSQATTGGSLRALRQAVERVDGSQLLKWSVVDAWGDHPAYIEAMADTVRTGLAHFSDAERDDVVIVFSAHSLPMSQVVKGDPYPAQVRATIDLLTARLGPNAPPSILAYQSAVGPMRWLEPSLTATLKRLGKEGAKSVLVVPVGFNCDHIETLYELDIEAAHTAKCAGITHFHRAPALNDNPLFLNALARIAADSLGCAGCSGCACGATEAAA